MKTICTGVTILGKKESFEKNPKGLDLPTR